MTESNVKGDQKLQYCGRFVGNLGYSYHSKQWHLCEQECGCDGRCGPGTGCQCNDCAREQFGIEPEINDIRQLKEPYRVSDDRGFYNHLHSKNPKRYKIAEPFVKSVKRNFSEARPVVTLCLRVKDIHEVDPSTDSFQLKCKFYYIWEADISGIKVEKKSLPMKVEAALFEEIAVPEKMKPSNATHIEYGETEYYILSVEESKLAMHFEATYTCRQVADLREFPFDAQSLQVDFLKRSDSFRYALTTIEFWKTAVEKAEWYVKKPRLVKDSRWKLTVEINIQRRPQYFVYKFFFILSTISLLGLTIFTFEPTDVDLRLQLLTSILLAIIAFQFVAGEEIPNVSYLTYYDKYSNSLLLTIFVFCLYSALAPHTIPENSLDQVDMICFVIFSLWMFLCLSLCTGFCVVKMRSIEKKAVKRAKGNCPGFRFAKMDYFSHIPGEEQLYTKPTIQKNHKIAPELTEF